jgi:cbb3-type cytochrome oxidase maturation protein
MNVIYVLIPLAIILVCIAIAVFFWAVRTNQFDDLERHGHSILFDDDIKKVEPKAKHSKDSVDNAENNDRP